MSNATHNRVRLGRPPKDGEAMLARVNIRIPKPVLAAVDRVVAKRKDGANTADVIRILLVDALERAGEL